MDSLFYVLFVLLTIPFFALLRGWVISIMWGWFVVPVFHLPVLGVLQAIGLALVAGMMLGHSSAKINKDKSLLTLVGEFIVIAFSPFVALFIGWIIHSFM